MDKPPLPIQIRDGSVTTDTSSGIQNKEIGSDPIRIDDGKRISLAPDDREVIDEAQTMQSMDVPGLALELLAETSGDMSENVDTEGLVGSNLLKEAMRLVDNYFDEHPEEELEVIAPASIKSYIDGLGRQGLSAVIKTWLNKGFSSIDSDKYSHLKRGSFIRSIVESDNIEIGAVLKDYMRCFGGEVGKDTLLRMGLIFYDYDKNGKWLEGLDEKDLNVFEETSDLVDFDDLAALSFLHGLDTDGIKSRNRILGFMANEHDIKRLMNLEERVDEDPPLGIDSLGRENKREMKQRLLLAVALTASRSGQEIPDKILDLAESDPNDSFPRQVLVAGLAGNKNQEEVYSRLVDRVQKKGNIELYKILQEAISMNIDPGIDSKLYDLLKSAELHSNYLLISLSHTILLSGEKYATTFPNLVDFLKRGLESIDLDSTNKHGINNIITSCIASGIELPDFFRDSLERFNSEDLNGIVYSLYLGTKDWRGRVFSTDEIVTEKFIKDGYACLPRNLVDLVDETTQLFDKEGIVSAEIFEHLFSSGGYYGRFFLANGAETINEELLRRARESVSDDLWTLLLSLDPESVAKTLKYENLEGDMLVFNEYGEYPVRVSLTKLIPENVLSSLRGRLSQSYDIEEMGEQVRYLLPFFDDSYINNFPEKQARVIRSMKKHPDFSNLIYQIRDVIYGIENDKYEEYESLLVDLALSPIPEIQKLKNQIGAQIFKSEDPKRIFEQINGIFARNNLPTMGKIFQVFRLLYPPEILSSKIDTNSSRVLQRYKDMLSEHGEEKRVRDLPYKIIYADLLRSNIRSGNESLIDFVAEIGGVAELLDLADSDFAQRYAERKDEVEIALQRLQILLSISNLKQEGLNDNTFTNPKDIISQIRSQLGLAPNETVKGWLEEAFIKPLGYTKYEELIDAVDQIKLDASNRNLSQIEQREDGAYLRLLQKGDLLKGFKSRYLESLATNGFSCPELLGSDADSDATPFDVDFAQITNEQLITSHDSLEDILSRSVANKYGDIVAVVRRTAPEGIENEEYANRFINTEANNKYDIDRYEIFGAGVHGVQHVGIRSSLGWYDIDALIVKDISHVDRLKFTIASRGVYIPIVDLTGRVVFTKEEFEENMQNLESLESIDLEGSSIEALMDSNSYLKDLFNSDAGVWEEYSLREHTEAVLGNFGKFFEEKFETSGQVITSAEMKVLLLLHDIGKPLSKKFEGNTYSQHKYTEIISKRILHSSAINKRRLELILSIISKDLVGEYIQGNVSVEAVGKIIKREAEYLGISADSYLDICSVYYLCDAGAYTEFAGGKRALDHLFVVDEERGELSFNADNQEKMRELKLRLLSS